mmetsp:Transcript_166/g.477  ORF Transcript_166/g.477 Transcript_166/m.477 type:complete len:346 (-) Transcript_166:313-1350(-)
MLAWHRRRSCRRASNAHCVHVSPSPSPSASQCPRLHCRARSHGGTGVGGSGHARPFRGGGHGGEQLLHGCGVRVLVHQGGHVDGIHVVPRNAASASPTEDVEVKVTRVVVKHRAAVPEPWGGLLAGHGHGGAGERVEVQRIERRRELGGTEAASEHDHAARAVQWGARVAKQRRQRGTGELELGPHPAVHVQHVQVVKVHTAVVASKHEAAVAKADHGMPTPPGRRCACASDGDPLGLGLLAHRGGRGDDEFRNVIEVAGATAMSAKHEQAGGVGAAAGGRVGLCGCDGRGRGGMGVRGSPGDGVLGEEDHAVSVAVLGRRSRTAAVIRHRVHIRDGRPLKGLCV